VTHRNDAQLSTFPSGFSSFFDPIKGISMLMQDLFDRYGKECLPAAAMRAEHGQ
jgi:hypothetical protein